MRNYIQILAIVSIFFVLNNDISAQQNQTIPLPKIGIDIGTADSPEDISVTLQILLLMTVLSLAPSLMIMTTAYLRLIIVFHFLKSSGELLYF